MQTVRSPCKRIHLLLPRPKPGKSRGSFVLRANAVAFVSLISTSAIGSSTSPQIPDLINLSLDQLGSIEITSVSRRPERLVDAPASVFVITSEDIRRSGVSTLPEALRLAPNLQVARVTSYEYAISARGFNNSIGNKLLVLVDGRTVYTPLFSGVFWDAQDVMLEDVDRIEVISGPGASLWGANAVNGVINVITRVARQTQGLLATAREGDHERGLALRYGGEISANGHFRFYAKGFEQDNTVLASGAKVPNSWNKQQIGFRADWQQFADEFTVQGDAYWADKEQATALGAPGLNGGNLLVRWSRPLANGGQVRVQSYYDHSERKDPVAFQDRMDIFDIEFQHTLPRASSHDILWGAGTRHAVDHATAGLLTTFIPGDRRLHWTNVFAQDEISLDSNLSVTVGAKIETNVYTGVEFLPNARLAWKPAADQLLWAALSRAVRAPSRIDREFYFPGKPPFFIKGGPGVQSEVANVIELGYRAQYGNVASYSATAFHHDYDKLRSGQPPPAVVENKIEGTVSGVETWGSYYLTRHWRLTAGALWQDQRLRVKPDSRDPVGPSALGNDPRYQWTLRSAFALSDSQDFDIAVRRVGALPNPVVAAYNAVDVNWVWRVSQSTALTLAAQNLFDPGHTEFGKPASANELRRSVLLKLVWRL